MFPAIIIFSFKHNFKIGVKIITFSEISMKEQHSAVLETSQPFVRGQEDSVYIETLACERRLLDAQKIRSYFMKNNYGIVDNPKEARFIVLVTCGFTNSTANVCFGSIEKYKDYDAKLIIVGWFSRRVIAYVFGYRHKDRVIIQSFLFLF